MSVSFQEVGDLLYHEGHINDKQLALVRRQQALHKVPQHKSVVGFNFVSEEDAYTALARVMGLDYQTLDPYEPSEEVEKAVPLKMVFNYKILPVAVENDTLTLAFAEPPTSLEKGNLRLSLGKKLNVTLSSPSKIHAIIKDRYGLGAATIQRLREERLAGDGAGEIIFNIEENARDSVVDTTISDFVDQVLLEALRLHATDIHIEPYPEYIRLRYRIDGMMQTVPVPRDLKHLQAALVSRLKIMASLNIAEKRLPQDGRISMKSGEDSYDLRVSIVPTKHGEAVCLRILGRHDLFLELGQLGMDAEQESQFEELTRLPQGLVLITGPTGSGKTTTLYAALTQANHEDRKIITLEDPVEYQISNISQIQIREELDFTFAKGLRSILRHDPDMVLIGEIRDAETAEIAVRAAQTGHLVFSTIHTNDSISVVRRLLEMNVDAFLLGSSLVCSIAQRLARRICRQCSTVMEAIPESVQKEMSEALGLVPEALNASFGVGCVECNHKGYRGRVAVYEFFTLNEELIDYIDPSLKTSRLRAIARNYGWQSIRELAWKKVQENLTTIDEVNRLTQRMNTMLKKRI